MDFQPTPELNKALAKAKADFPKILENKRVKIPTKTGREIAFSYAELEEIADSITPTLSGYGLVIVSQTVFFESKFCLLTTLRHESGEAIASYFPLPSDPSSDPKDLGAKISYGRRYNTICLLEITTIEPNNPDQRAEQVRKLAKDIRIEASGNTKLSEIKKGDTSFLDAINGLESTSTSQLITPNQAKRLWAIAKNELKLTDEQVKSAQTHFGFAKTELISQDKYESLINYLKSLASKTSVATQDLYPANNEIVRQVRIYTKHEPAWILAQCKHYGHDRPGAMPLADLEKLTADMCVDWALSTGVMSDRTAAYTSVQGAISFANGAGQPLAEAAMKWLGRYQSSVPV